MPPQNIYNFGLVSAASHHEQLTSCEAPLMMFLLADWSFFTNCSYNSWVHHCKQNFPASITDCPHDASHLYKRAVLTRCFLRHSYVTSILGFKLSLLLSYLRFMTAGWVRMTTIVVAVGCCLFHLAFLLVQINLCQPVSETYSPSKQRRRLHFRGPRAGSMSCLLRESFRSRQFANVRTSWWAGC